MRPVASGSGSVPTTVLISLGIQGFKALFEATLVIGPFSLIIGRNGSGKSSAVEAMQWLRDATFLGLDAATPREIQFRDLVNRRSVDIFLDLRYQRDSDSYPVHYSLRAIKAQKSTRPIVGYERCVIGRTTAARTVLRSRKGRRGPAYRWVVAGRNSLALADSNELGLRYTKLRGIPVATDFVDFLARAVFLRLSPKAISTPARPEPRGWRPILADDGYDLAALLDRLGSKRRHRVVARLKAIFPGVEALDVEATGLERRFSVTERMKAQGGTKPFAIPSTLLSEGMRRLVAIFALLEVDPGPSILVIEEIENGLDPWTLERVLDALREASERMQIVLTTHSPFLLDHVSAREVVHVTRERGDTTYKRVSEIADAARYEAVLPPGAMYLAKVLGDNDKVADGPE